MKTVLNKQQNRLGTYLTAGMGIGCLASTADAAMISLDTSANNLRAGVLEGGGILQFMVSLGYGFYVSGFRDLGAVVERRPLSVANRGNTSMPSFVLAYNGGDYLDYNVSLVAGDVGGNGAVFGDDNFSFFDQDGDGAFETLIQFSFDGNGGGFVVGAAVDADDSVNIDFAAAVEALSSASSGAIPEPSQHVALLALGAAGLIARRRSKAA